MNNWKATPTMDYFYRERDGRILGAIWHYASNSAIYSAKIFVDEFPFTNESEKFLGHYINKRDAEHAVEQFWQKESQTLIGN